MSIEEVGGNSAVSLKQHLEAIERLEAEKKEIGQDIKDRFDLAAAEGFDKKILKEILRRRKLTEAELEAWDQLVATYEAAVKGVGPDQGDLIPPSRQAAQDAGEKGPKQKRLTKQKPTAPGSDSVN